MNDIVELESDDPDVKIMYFKMKIPLMQLRDGVFKILLKKRPDGSYLSLSETIEHPKYPVNNECLRIEMFKTM